MTKEAAHARPVHLGWLGVWQARGGRARLGHQAASVLPRDRAALALMMMHQLFMLTLYDRDAVINQAQRQDLPPNRGERAWAMS